MPYTPRYLMEQAARGRPHPSGRPEDHLFQALRQASPMDLERAIHMGAQPMGARDARGQTPVEVLLSEENRHRARPEQVLACARHLLRHNALANAGRQFPSVLVKAAAWADSPAIAASWFMLWAPQSCRALGDQWHRPDDQGKTALDHWKDKATPELLKVLERAFPERSPADPQSTPTAPRKPGPR